MEMKNKTAKCVYNKTHNIQSDMLRFVLGPNRRIYFDIKQNLPGESIYITNSKNTLELVMKQKMFHDLFDNSVIFDNLDLDVRRQYLESMINILSLAKKSGNILVGKRQIKEYINLSDKNPKKSVLLQASDASNAEKFVETDIIKIFEVFPREMISKACGKENLVYILIQGKFAMLIEDIISKYQIYMNN